MRQAVAQATHHCAHRAAFGKVLADQPLMQNVLADLAVESEAGTVAMPRRARAYDDETQRHFARLATAVVKYWVCKRGPMLVAEALECLGGNGYVEESMMPRLYREVPLNSIWEGSGNVMCLDVLRALSRDGEAAQNVIADLVQATGDLPGARDTADFLVKTLRSAEAEASARSAVERLALLASAAALNRGASARSEPFARARLAEPDGSSDGTARRPRTA